MTFGPVAQADGSDSGARQNPAQYLTEGIVGGPIGSSATAIFEQVNGIWFISPGSGSEFFSIRPQKGFSATSAIFYSWFLQRNTGETGKLHFLNSDGAEQFSVVPNADGSISVTSGVTILVKSPVGVWFPGVPFHGKVAYTVSTTVGRVQIWLNGAAGGAIDTGANVNTAATPGNLPISSFQMESTGTGAYLELGYPYWHDISGPSPFTGPIAGIPMALAWMPIADVGTPQLTPNGLTHNWQNAAAIPASAPNFNSAATVGLTDVASFGTLPGNISQILSIAHFDYSLTVGGSSAFTKSLLYSSTTVSGTQNFLAGGPVTYRDVTCYSIASPTTLLANIAKSTVIAEVQAWNSQIQRTA